MPCKDPTSGINVYLDGADRLTGFDFFKLTCSKEIGGESKLQDYCMGMGAEDILDLEFSVLMSVLKPSNVEDEFFLYMEWDALLAALAQYLGREESVDRDRYQIDAIEYEGDSAVIRQLIRPLEEMPKIVSCHSKARRGSEKT